MPKESDTKSKRVRAAIRRQCDGWQAGTFRGVIRNGKDPQWLQLVDGTWEFVPERLEAVRMAIRLFLDGHGASKIIDRLNEAGLAVSARTAASNLYKLLRLPALVGAKTLNVGDAEYRLEGYYPRVLTDDAFTDLQVALTQRGRRKGKGEIPGIITGLRVTYCGYCGSAMVGQNLTTRRRDDQGKVRDMHRRLACCSDQAGRRCPVKGGSTSVAPIERALLTYCADQINLSALLDRTAQDGPVRQRVATARAKEAECERKLKRLTDVLLQDDEAPPPTLLRQIRDIEAELVSVRGTLSAAESELSTLSRKTPAAAQAWAELVEAVKAQDYDARLKARQLVADTFARIVVYRRGIHLDSEDSGKVLDLVIIPHGGAARVLRVNRKTGEWIAGEDASLDSPFP